MGRKSISVRGAFSVYKAPEDGIGEQEVYRLGSSASAPAAPTGTAYPPPGWLTAPPDCTEENRYRWASKRTKQGDAVGEWQTPYRHGYLPRDGSDGSPGTGGTWYQWAYKRTATYSAPDGVAGNASASAVTDAGWTVGARLGVNITYKYEWGIQREMSGNDVAGAWRQPVLVGSFGERGESGETGIKAAPRSGEWAPGEEYFQGDTGSGERMYDIKRYNGGWYICVKSHTSDYTNAPDSANASAYWAYLGNYNYLATGFLYSAEAYIEHMQTYGIRAYDAEGNVTAQVAGSDGTITALMMYTPFRDLFMATHTVLTAAHGSNLRVIPAGDGDMNLYLPYASSYSGLSYKLTGPVATTRTYTGEVKLRARTPDSLYYKGAAISYVGLAVTVGLVRVVSLGSDIWLVEGELPDGCYEEL